MGNRWQGQREQFLPPGDGKRGSGRGLSQVSRRGAAGGTAAVKEQFLAARPPTEDPGNPKRDTGLGPADEWPSKGRTAHGAARRFAEGTAVRGSRSRRRRDPWNTPHSVSARHATKGFSK